MAQRFQVTLDAASPAVLAAFWKVALDYRDDDPPPGYASWDEVLEQLPAEHRDDSNAIIDPDGVGPRLFFLKVAEPKTAKNRVHLDVNIAGAYTDPAEGWQAVLERSRALVAAGGTVVGERSGTWGERWIVMTDPDGNEFCLQ